MGEHYGSVHILDGDDAEIGAALVAVAEELDVRFFVAPRIGRWTSAYPSHHGQDSRVGEALARRLAHHVIQLQLHDGDIFSYQYYRGGAPVDAFCSEPDYFGELPAGEREQLRGRPEQFLPLLVDGASAVESLRAILHPPAHDAAARDARRVHALEVMARARSEGRTPSQAELASLMSTATEAATQMERMAAILGIVGTRGSYEYIQEGERPMPGYTKRTLAHIPNLVAERAAARSVASAVRAERKRLAADGHLLLDATKKGRTGAFPPQPVWAAEHDGSYLLAWGTGGMGGTVAVERVSTPWSALTPLFEIPGTVARLAFSAASNLVAVGHASGEWSVEIYERESGTRRFRAPIARASDALAFSSDGRLLIVKSDNEAALLDVESGERVATIPIAGAGREVIVRPGGDVGLVYDQSVGLHIIDLHRSAHAGTIEFPRTYHVVDWVHALAFTDDGEHLCVSMPGIVAVYEWKAIVTRRRLEDPWRSITSSNDPKALPAYGIVHDAARGVLIYGGMPGELRALSLTTGDDRLLRSMPGQEPIGALARSADRSTLAITVRPDALKRQPRPPRFQVWSYQALWSLA